MVAGDASMASLWKGIMTNDLGRNERNWKTKERCAMQR
jgi:hypothetical protein